METITRNVKDIGTDDLRTLEHMLGRRLAENQTITISVAEVDANEAPLGDSAGVLPNWCNVFEGLSDDDVADIEKIALMRANLSRTFD